MSVPALSPVTALFFGRQVLLAVFVLLSLIANGEAQAQAEMKESVLTAFSQQHVEGGYQVELQFAGAPQAKLSVLASPNRIVLDLDDTVSAVKDMRLDADPIVSDLRQGLVAKDRYRLIFSLKRLAVPEMASETSGNKTTLRLKLREADAKVFADAVARHAVQAQPAAPSPATKPGEAPIFTIVVDPGHGGVDTGAIGKHGTQEKDVNLRFGLALRDTLASDPRIRVVMTRADDTYVSLGERSEIGRREGAKLFISVHSDSIRYSDLRGATVYTLSEKASDSLSREVAESENSADRFVDPKWRDDKPEVFDILIELMRRETDNLSEHFAAGLVQELGRHDIRLIRNPKRSAGFKVLIAPDVPSVLVEVGYLSNVDDEQLLLDESWRKDTAAAIGSAVRRFLGLPAREPAVER